MKATELIALLEVFVKKYGDLPVYIKKTIDEYDNMLAMSLEHKELNLDFEYSDEVAIDEDDDQGWIEAFIISDEP